jgi:serine/threonine protein kinase
VGFDSRGVVKLFDFGFAMGIPDEGRGLLHDKAGTVRYMAPEVALSQGYGVSADTFSFGILFWEIAALRRPFQFIRSAEKFEQRVFGQGVRPAIDDSWPKEIKDIMSACWSHDQHERPSMQHVKSVLSAFINNPKVNCTERKFTRRSVRHLSMAFDGVDIA